MTIIQPNKNKNKINFLISIMALGAVFSAVWGVFLYNQLVNFRHEAGNYEKTVRQAEAENAELKNKLHQLIETTNSESSLNGNSLIIEKNPIYVKGGAEISAR